MHARLWLRERQFPLDSTVQGPARTVLRGKDADSRSVTDQIGAVEEIHDRDARLQLAHLRYDEAARDRGIDLDIEGEVSGIREAASQPAAIDPIDAEHVILPVVDAAHRRREGLVVIQEDVVLTDIGQLIRPKVELSRLDLRALGDAESEVDIRVEIVVSIRTGSLGAVNAALVVIEGLE